MLVVISPQLGASKRKPCAAKESTGSAHNMGGKSKCVVLDMP
jgi:hypothetical protein